MNIELRGISHRVETIGAIRPISNGGAARVTSAAQSTGAALSEAREWRRFFVERAVACAM